MIALGRPARAAFGAALAAIALGATVYAAESSREALIARWAAANHRTVAAFPSPSAFATPPPALHAFAQRELTRPGYHLSKGGAPAVPRPTWWELFWQWLQDRWDQFWQATFGRTRLGRGSAIAIGDLLMAAAALALLLAGWRLFSELRFDRRSRIRSIEAAGAAADANALFAAANRRAHAGDYGGASRLLFGATVSALALRGAVRDDRSATVGDFRRTLRARDAGSVAGFDDVASAFVVSAYAERPVEPSAWERARDAFLGLTRKAGS